MTARRKAEPPIRDIVLFVLGEMGAERGPVHIEDLTARCYEKSKSKFAWTLPKYAGQMNIEVTRVALGELRHFKKEMTGPPLVESIEDDSRRGKVLFKMTAEGHARYVSIRNEIAQALGEQSGLATKLVPERKIRDAAVQRLTSSHAYKKWQADAEDTISVWNFFQAIRADPLVKPERVRTLLNTLATAVKDDTDLTELVTFLDNRFSATYQKEAQLREDDE